MSKAEVVTERNWDTFISQKDPMVVLCWAAWDDKSVNLKGIIEKISKEWTSPRIHFGLFNTDENVAHSRKLKITTIPLLMYFIRSKEQERTETVLDKAGIVGWIQRNLKPLD
ncbi:MAG: thioredoxin family protein [Candidatus Ranarchaeia archaeon]|jgi:thioredoxin-like negative regulator of GroEL